MEPQNTDSLAVRGGLRGQSAGVRLVVILSASLLIILLGWWLSYSSVGMQQSSIAELLVDSEELQPIDTTHTTCSPVTIDCEEAWRTKIGTFMRFEKPGQAEYWGTILGDDGRSNGRFVLDFRGVELSLEQRRHAIDILFADRDWN